MKAETSLKAGDPVRAGEAVRVPVGTLEAGEVFFYGNPKPASWVEHQWTGLPKMRLRNSAMAANRAALPSPPSYAPPKTYNMVSNV
jgi:hypothetical protein